MWPNTLARCSALVALALMVDALGSPVVRSSEDCPHSSRAMCAANALSFSVLEEGLSDDFRILSRRWGTSFLSSAKDLSQLFRSPFTSGFLTKTVGAFEYMLFSDRPPRWSDDALIWSQPTSDGRRSSVIKALPKDALGLGGGAVYSTLTAPGGIEFGVDGNLQSLLDKTVLALCKFVATNVVVKPGLDDNGEFLVVSRGCPNAYYGRFNDNLIVIELKAGTIKGTLVSALNKLPFDP